MKTHKKILTLVLAIAMLWAMGSMKVLVADDNPPTLTLPGIPLEFRMKVRPLNDRILTLAKEIGKQLRSKKLFVGNLSFASNPTWTDFNIHDPGVTILELQISMNHLRKAMDNAEREITKRIAKGDYLFLFLKRQ